MVVLLPCLVVVVLAVVLLLFAACPFGNEAEDGVVGVVSCMTLKLPSPLELEFIVLLCRRNRASA